MTTKDKIENLLNKYNEAYEMLYDIFGLEGGWWAYALDDQRESYWSDQQEGTVVWGKEMFTKELVEAAQKDWYKGYYGDQTCKKSKDGFTLFLIASDVSSLGSTIYIFDDSKKVQLSEDLLDYF